MFATGNGVPPTAGLVGSIQLINNANAGAAMRSVLSTSPSTGLQDYNVDGALCLSSLMTGSDATAQALQASVNEVRRSGDLQGKPALIVHGRSDALLPVLNGRPQRSPSSAHAATCVSHCW